MAGNLARQKTKCRCALLNLPAPAPSSDLWLGKLTQLRAGNGEASDGVSGPAPHKPLLLLSIIDLAESGKILGRVIPRTPELVLRFRALGTLVDERWPTRLQLRLPFYHLKTQGFWQAFTEEMQPAQSPQSCAAIELHPDFFALLADRDFRVKARLVLIARYFTEVEKVALFECLGIAGASARLSSRDANSVLAKALADGKRKGRSARFQVRVLDNGDRVAMADFLRREIDSQRDSAVEREFHVTSETGMNFARPRLEPSVSLTPVPDAATSAP